MTNYSKERLELVLETMGDIGKDYEEYLDSAQEVNRLFRALGKDSPASENETDREVKTFWDILLISLMDVHAFLKRETGYNQALYSRLEDKVARLEMMRAQTNPEVMPFTDEDIIGEGA